MRTSIALGLSLPLVASLAAVVAFLTGSLSSRAVQAPVMSLDMDPAGNTYDAATNTMSVGTIDGCLASETANPGTHTHIIHVVIQNVEDLVGWQARLNFDPSAMKPVDVDFTPFVDTKTSQSISFINLPIEAATSTHRDVLGAVTPSEFAIPGTTLLGSAYFLEQDATISPDTPAKNPPDDSSYSAPTGGVLAAVKLEVEGDQSGRTLFIQLDDDNPYPPGSKLVVFTGSGGLGTDDISLAGDSLRSGYHAEGAAACASVPTPTNGPTPTPYVPPLPTDLPTLPPSTPITDPVEPTLAPVPIPPSEPGTDPAAPTVVPAPPVVGASVSDSQAPASAGSSTATTSSGVPPSPPAQAVAGALSLPRAGRDGHEGGPQLPAALLVACAGIATAVLAAAAGVRWRRRRR